MSTVALVAGLVAAAVVAAVLPGRRRVARQRLAGQQLPVPAGPEPAGTRRRPRVPVDRYRLVAALAGVAAAMLVGSWVGLLVGAATAVALDRGLRRLEPAGVRARRRAEAADLPLAADLLAVALQGGAPVEQATAAVAAALPGPLGQRLGQVARLLELGAAAGEAWQQLAPVAGAARLTRAAVRSAEHGGALAEALGRLAADLRADRAVAVEAAGRRAGVLIVLPLGLCFLPAFMLAGLVPVIVAVLGDVL